MKVLSFERIKQLGVDQFNLREDSTHAAERGKEARVPAESKSTA